MIKVVLIDDEPKALQSLKWEIENFCEDVEIMAMFDSAKLALSYLKKTQDVSCIFLDIEMPEMDGFQLLDEIPNRDFAVIITTAYDQYGINAIKERALDYLLKPIDSDDLKEAVAKVKEFLKGSDKSVYDETLLEAIAESNSSNKKIGINTDGKIIFLMPSEIVCCEADGNYTKIFLTNGEELMVTQTLKKLEDKLTGREFFRVHNSYVVNLTKVREYLKTESYLVLQNDRKIPVSRQKKSFFLDQF